MAVKFCRGLLFDTGGVNLAKESYPMKFMYEFWGFCVNGGPSLFAPGGFAGSTTIAVGSNGATLPQATINVVSTTNFPTSGTAYILTSTGTHIVTYTGTTGTTLTGASGGTGTMSTGGTVNSTASIGMQANFSGIATTIAAGSNGATLPQGTINVLNTTGFPASGSILVVTNQGAQTVAYTGTTATTFTGCTGGLGTMSTGGNVTTTSLMTLGADGYTNATTVFRYDGYTDFYAASGPFNSNMIGKCITTWKSASGSSEDGIYKIIAFKDPTNIVIDINSGGTPSASDGYKPSVTLRTSINYRVCDINTAAIAAADTNFYVMQLDPTGINAGQANSQCKLTLNNTLFTINAILSPAGTWTGAAFTDGTSTILPNYSGTTTITGNTCSGLLYINMWGDKDFLIYLLAFAGATYHQWMHLEIPERLYTLAQDPNPIIVNINGSNTTDNLQFSTTQTTAGYGGGFYMKCADGVTRQYRTSIKALTGDGNATSSMSIANTAATLTDFRAGANQYTGNLLNTSGVLSLPGVAGQYALARVRIRRARFANTFMNQFTRFSSGTDFILASTKGSAVPWDKTVLPYSLWRF